MAFWEPITQVNLHPQDYIWTLLGNDIWLAHEVSREWLRWRIETMGRAAEDAVDKMVDDFNWDHKFDENQFAFRQMGLDTWAPRYTSDHFSSVVKASASQFTIDASRRLTRG